MTRARLVSFLAVAAVSLLCASTAAQSDTLSVGTDLAGEQCSLRSAPTLVAPTSIQCGAEAGGVGTVNVYSVTTVLPDAADARLVQIAKQIATAEAAQNETMRCDPAEWLAAPGGLVMQLCRIQSNDWPRIVVAEESAGQLAIAEGPPSLLPVLTNAANMRFSSQAPPIDQALARLRGRVTDGALHAPSNDAVSYRHLVERGRLESGMGDYASSEADYRAALDIETRLFGENSTAAAETVLELALQVSNQSRFDEAASLFQRATPSLEGSEDPLARARLASYLALDAANRRRYADALGFARTATAAYRVQIAREGSDGAIVAQGELAHSLRIEAEMALRLDDVASARAAGEESLWIVTERPGLPLFWRPDTLDLMGAINARDGRAVQAERNYLDALDLNKKLFGDGPPSARASMTLGAFYDSEQDHADAIKAYNYAFGILAKDAASRRDVVAEQIVPYLDAASGQGSAAPDADMFRASQYVGAGVTDATIARLAARQAADDAGLATSIRNLQDAERVRDTARVELASENAKADDVRDSRRVEEYSTDLTLASAKVDTLNANLIKAYPAYENLAEPGPAELSQARAELKAGEALVSFAIGNGGSFGLLLTSSGLTVKPLDITADALDAQVSELRAAVQPSLGRTREFSLGASHALYQKLLGPFDGELKNVTHLIVVSTGSLANLPFALLVTETPGAKTDYASAAWLVRKLAISTVPSPRAFVTLRSLTNASTAKRSGFLGVGNPDFAGSAKSATALANMADMCMQSGPVPADLLRGLPPLPDTANELETVGRDFGVDRASLLTGSRANEANVRARLSGHYDVVYFATHGLLPGELRCQSEPGLALSPPERPATSAADDGLLTASEIASLHMDAGLVVLSACNTAAGGGGRYGGGALDGLADAFFDAGADAVLASHWQIPSHSTATLMTSLFRQNSQHPSLGIAESLRAAQLQLIADPSTAHPFNWAAFTLIGDGGGAAMSASAQPSRAGGS